MKTLIAHRLTRLFLFAIPATIMAFLATSPVLADESTRGTVLLIDRVTRTAHVPVPTIGQTMTQVKKTFGEPERIFDAVGVPPITRWVYPDFTVYFESDRVIHAVVNKASEDESLG
jgi:hypothetical protein